MVGMLLYMLRSLFPPDCRRRWPAFGAAALLAALLAGTGAYGSGLLAKAPVRRISREEVETLLARAQRARNAYDGAAGYIGATVQPIEKVLRSYRDDPMLARRIAVAVVRQSNRLRIDRKLLTGVLLVENPDLNPRARSVVGARGLMQVMPLHRGAWPCSGPLEDVETNICYGAHIFADNLREADGDVRRALLRYNGCVRGVNTPDCAAYPSHVLARARRLGGRTPVVPAE
ncbi:MAG: lytic transglycosylase domain-containing protein [Gemmatimonadetes bacterium]|nr:lytic transglycosylase domain-containing protein [Gemmatimonadota bacterium]